MLSAVHAVSAQEQPTAVVDVPTLARFSPRARADIVATISEQWDRAIAAGIATPRRAHHFLAQIATETGGFRLLEENLNYSAERLVQVFPRRVTWEDAQRLAHKPVAIANHVYNGRLGNSPPTDGWTFRGSGLLQLTGRANFAGRGKELGVPLEEKPELARLPATAFSTAVAYWRARNINVAADKDDLVTVRRLINGGTNGLPESRVWLARARRYFVDASEKAQQPPGPTPDEASAAQDLLQTLGFLSRTSDKAVDPSELQNAVKSFQASRGLPETGRVDDDTLYELTDPEKFRPE